MTATKPLLALGDALILGVTPFRPICTAQKVILQCNIAGYNGGYGAGTLLATASILMIWQWLAAQYATAREMRAPIRVDSGRTRRQPGFPQAYFAGAPGRRRPWRVHLGRARPSAGGRTAGNQRAVRHVCGRDERDHGGRRSGARRAGRGAHRLADILAWGQPRRPPAAAAARDARPAAAVAAGPSPMRGLCAREWRGFCRLTNSIR